MTTYISVGTHAFKIPFYRKKTTRNTWQYYLAKYASIIHLLEEVLNLFFKKSKFHQGPFFHPIESIIIFITQFNKCTY